MTRSRGAAALVVAFVCLRCASASAQEAVAPARAITLPDAIAYARAHQPAVRTALARVAARAAQGDVPRAQWYPLVGVTAQIFGATSNNTTGTYLGTPQVDVPRVGGTLVRSTGTFQPYASTFVGAGVTQELLDFGRIAAQAAAADALVDVERQRARFAELDVTFDVEEAYYAVFAAKSIVSSSEDAYQRALVHRDLAKAGVGAGLRPPIELTRAEADLSRFDIGRLRARGNLLVAQSVLAAAVGAPDPALDITLTAPPQTPDMPDLQTAMREAAARDPRVLQALAQLHAQELKSRAIAAEARPDVSLTATISGRAGGAPPSGTGAESATGNGWIPNVPNYDLGAIFSWPLFDGTIDARTKASRAEEQVRREEISLAQEQDVAAVRQAFDAVQIARGVIPGLVRAVEAARANYAQADARFKAGLGTSVELADAEALRTDAEIQLAYGYFELARARAAFGRTIAEGL